MEETGDSPLPEAVATAEAGSSSETPAEAAERELDERKSREALLTDEQRAAIAEKCEKAKLTGNDHFGHGRFAEAETAYGEAIDGALLSMGTQLAVYHSNRAAARIKLERWAEAIVDCTKAIDLGAPNDKPLERRAYARLHSGDDNELDAALADYEALLSKNPSSATFLSAKASLQAKIAARNEKLKAEMMQQLKNLGNLCLKPFGLSTDNFELKQQEGGGYSVGMKKT